MNSSLTFVLAFTVLLAGAPMENLVGASEGDHHEHEGITDALAGEAGHHHGDADDHHESPEDPCHHHVVHCCCAHLHVFTAGASQAVLGACAFERLAIPCVVAQSDPFARRLFHVPIA